MGGLPFVLLAVGASMSKTLSPLATAGLLALAFLGGYSCRQRARDPCRARLSLADAKIVSAR